MEEQFPDWEWSFADPFEATPTMEFFRKQGAAVAGSGHTGMLLVGRRRYIKRSNKKATICLEWLTGNEFSFIATATACNIYCSDGSKIRAAAATREALIDNMHAVETWFRDRKREIVQALDEEQRQEDLANKIAALRLTGIEAVRARYARSA